MIPYNMEYRKLGSYKRKRKRNRRKSPKGYKPPVKFKGLDRATLRIAYRDVYR